MLHVGMFGYDDTCLKVYDPNEPDVKKKLIGIFNNNDDLNAKLGISKSAIQRSYANKTRTYSKTLNKDVTIRLAKRELTT